MKKISDRRPSLVELRRGGPPRECTRRALSVRTSESEVPAFARKSRGLRRGKRSW